MLLNQSKSHMKSFFEDGVYQEVRNRLDHINEDTQSQWGKMNAAQMMYHCLIPLNIILQRKDYGVRPNWLINLLFKKSLFSDKLWQKNLPTARAFRIDDDRDFNNEKRILLELLNQLNAQRMKSDWHAHPVFGKLTKDEWGKLQYKHLDHHIRQFGA